MKISRMVSDLFLNLALGVGLVAFCGNALAATFDPSIPASVKAGLEADIRFVSDFQGTATTAIYAQIFNEKTLDGQKLVKFFDQRIKLFSLNDCGGGTGVAACVIPGISDSTMWITNFYITANIPQVFRMSVIFHEARHTESGSGNWGHAICPTPYLDDNGKDIVGIVSGTLMAGKPACDTTVLGAYGLQAILLKNVEKACSNCNEKTREDAQIFGDDTINRISNLSARKALKADVR